MDIEKFVKSVRNNIKQEVYNQEELLFMCDKVEELIEKPKYTRPTYSSRKVSINPKNLHLFNLK